MASTNGKLRSASRRSNYFYCRSVSFLRGTADGDDITLIKDLFSDWTSGESVDLGHFIPTKYFLKLSFTQYELLLNVNENNIVNKPNDVDENGKQERKVMFLAHYALAGPRLDFLLPLVFDKFQPQITDLQFDLQVTNRR